MGGRFKNFEELDCWKACTEVRRYVSKVIREFPADERFALVDDMKRAARSTTHNIAEGYGRFHSKENIQFCRHSRGSLYELLDQFITASEAGYVTPERLQKARDLIDKALALLNGYINYLARAHEEKRLTTHD